MHHARLDKRQFRATEVHRPQVLDRGDVHAHIEVHGQRLGAVSGGEQRLGLQPLDQFRQRAGVIHLRVVADDVLDTLGIDDRSDPRLHLIEAVLLHRVDKNRLVAHDNVGVPGRAPPRHVTVEIADVPINRADPPDLLRHLYSFECVAHHLFLAAVAESR